MSSAFASGIGLRARSTFAVRIVPLDAPAPTLPIARPAKRVGDWAALKPQPSENDRPMVRILDELREDRV